VELITNKNKTKNGIVLKGVRKKNSCIYLNVQLLMTLNHSYWLNNYELSNIRILHAVMHVE